MSSEPVENCRNRARFRRLGAPLSLAVTISATLSAACNAVDCRAVCTDTLRCEVAFAPADDPSGQEVTSGERSDLDSCILGCEESKAVDSLMARCIDQAAKLTDRQDCQEAILQCLGETTSN